MLCVAWLYSCMSEVAVKPKEAARAADISIDTLKRWLAAYSDYFSPGATPPPGRQRNLDAHDLRVLFMIASLRDAGMSHEEVGASLERARADEWRDLPPLPDGFDGDTIPANVAASRASEMVANAVLQRELQLVRAQLDAAATRVEYLEAELADVRGADTSKAQQISALEKELERARGEVAAARARLASYSLGMSDRPVPAALLIIVTAVVAVLLVVLVLIVARLVM